MQRMANMSILKYERVIEKNSYDRRVYLSVEDKSISYITAQN